MIFLRTCSGLCNRLRTMASGMRLAREFGKKLHVFWRVDSDMNACFTDLFFVPKGMVVNESEPESLFSRFLFNPKNHFATMPEDRDRFLSRALLKRGRGLLVHTDWANFYPTHDYHWLKPLPFIQEHIDEVKAVWGVGLIGLHIRRTDNEMSIRYSPLSLFEDKIRDELRKNPNQRFFLATDDVLTKELLCTEFGDSVLTRDGVAARNMRKGVQDAVIDLYLLASCTKVYGSYYSSFSETAAHIGCIPLEKLTVEGVQCEQ